MEISMDTSQFKLPEANQVLKQAQKSEKGSEFGMKDVGEISEEGSEFGALQDVGKVSEEGSEFGMKDVGKISEEGSEFGALHDVGQKGELVNVFA